MVTGVRQERDITRLMAGSMRFRTVSLAALAALCPFLTLSILSGVADLDPRYNGLALAVALIISTALLWALARAVRPIWMLGMRLEEFSGGAAETPFSGGVDDYRRICANLDAVAAKLEALNRRAERDAITHLPVREEFLGCVAADLQKSRQESLIGLVRFANYERMAAYDGVAAQRVLRAFGRRIQDAVHAARKVGHVDRDCFAIWFSGVDRKRAAAELKALSYVLGQDITDAALTVAPDIQVGFSIYPLDADDAANLLSRAFVSLARPQRTADGRIAFFAASAKDARKAFALEQDLRQAVRRGELGLHYQPLVDVATGKVRGAEALLRWRHPELGDVPPAQFVRLIEDSGLVHEIGHVDAQRGLPSAAAPGATRRSLTSPSRSTCPRTNCAIPRSRLRYIARSPRTAFPRASSNSS